MSKPNSLIILCSLILALLAYLAIQAEKSTFKKVKQISLDCFHYMQNLRLSLPERYSYKDSRACPIEFFEYAHIGIHSKDPSAEILEEISEISSIQSRAAIMLTMNDTYKEYVNCSLKIYLIGSIYAAPRGSNRPVQIFPLMYRPQGVPINLKFLMNMNQTQEESVGESKLLDTSMVQNNESLAVRQIMISSFEMLQGYDYIIKMKKVSVEAICKGVPYEVENEGFLMSLAVVRTDLAYPQYGTQQLELIIRWLSTIGVIVASLWVWLDRKRAMTDSLGLMIVGVVSIAAVGFCNPLWPGIKRSVLLHNKWSIIGLELFAFKLSIASVLVLNTVGLIFCSHLVEHSSEKINGKKDPGFKRRMATGIVTMIGVAYLALSFFSGMDLATASGPQPPQESRQKLFSVLDKLTKLCVLVGGTIIVLYYLLLQSGFISSIHSSKKYSSIGIYSILVCLTLSRFHWSSKQAKSIFTIQLATIGMLSILSILVNPKIFKKVVELDLISQTEDQDATELERLNETPKTKKET